MTVVEKFNELVGTVVDMKQTLDRTGQYPVTMFEMTKQGEQDQAALTERMNSIIATLPAADRPTSIRFVRPNEALAYGYHSGRLNVHLYPTEPHLPVRVTHFSVG